MVFPGYVDSYSRFQCALCGHTEEDVPDSNTCRICAGEMLPPVPMAVELGLDLGSLTRGADSLSIHRVLAQYANCCGIQFFLGDTRLRSEQLFQPEAVMPVIALEAMRLWQSIEQRPGTPAAPFDSLEITFSESSNGFFPLAAYPPPVGSDVSSTLRLLVFILAARRVLGLTENARIDLVPFIAQWDKIEWDGETIPQIPVPEGFDLNFQMKEFVTPRATSPTSAPAGTQAIPNSFASQST